MYVENFRGNREFKEENKKKKIVCIRISATDE